MPVYTLDIEDDYSFDLIGISSHVHDYRLSWALNKHMGWMLERQNDVVVKTVKNLSFHALFEYNHEQEMTLIALLSNKSENGFLLPELQQFDYLLKIENLQHELNDAFYKQLRNTSFIQTVMVVDASKIKSRHNLIYTTTEEGSIQMESVYKK